MGDAVEDFRAVGLGELIPETTEVEPSGDLASLGRDSRDSIGEVNVGENLPVDPLKFVEVD